MRILHLADIHLDTLLLARSEPVRRRLRDASRRALTAAVQLAVDRAVDAVLVAGDLFDGPRLTLGTELFLQRALRPLTEAGIPLFYATGNHDPGVGSGGARRLEWPANVHRFPADEPRTVEVVRGGVVVGTVTGIGHATDRESRDLSTHLRPPADRKVPAVAILHTQVGGARGGSEHERYAPSELSTLRGAGFDYWALGHVHAREVLSTLPGIAYPGNLQGRSPRETGAKGGLLVELDAPGAPARIEFTELAPIRWERLRIEGLEGVHGGEELLARVESAWDAHRQGPEGPGSRDVLVRIELGGPCPLHAVLSRDEERSTLVAHLEGRLGVLEAEVRIEGLRPAVPLEGALERPDAAGEALRLIQALQGGDASPSRALGISAGDLAGRLSLDLGSEAALDAYLRGLLEDGDRIALEGFLALGDPREGSA
jgi:DNA repair protein SbcD/Mre11